MCCPEEDAEKVRLGSASCRPGAVGDLEHHKMCLSWLTVAHQTVLLSDGQTARTVCSRTWMEGFLHIHSAE